ncbi:hypothetical protein BDZ91DRAFT_747089 [Kalaharituber pfeilii]|nr:hypothetical protein BDZ91DRAFT_747089 [Kalaharituber pfeilii]
MDASGRQPLHCRPHPGIVVLIPHPPVSMQRAPARRFIQPIEPRAHQLVVQPGLRKPLLAVKLRPLKHVVVISIIHNQYLLPVLHHPRSFGIRAREHDGCPPLLRKPEQCGVGQTIVPQLLSPLYALRSVYFQKAGLDVLPIRAGGAGSTPGEVMLLCCCCCGGCGESSGPAGSRHRCAQRD